MKLKGITLLLSALAAGCQPQEAGHKGNALTPLPPAAAASATTPPTNTPTQPAKFEIRDFAVDIRKSDSYETWKGRGTIVAKEPSMSKGAYMVWLSVKKGHANDEIEQTMELVTDGFGTITKSGYLAGDDAKKRSVRYFDWKVLGYAPLLEGQLIPAP